MRGHFLLLGLDLEELFRAIWTVESASLSVALDNSLGSGVFHANFFRRAVNRFVFGHDKVD